MGILSAIILVFLLKKSETTNRFKWTAIGYLLATPQAFIGSLIGGLMLPPVLGTLIFGGGPLVIGTVLELKLSK